MEGLSNVPTKVAEVFALTGQINDKIGLLRSKLNPVIQESPTNADKDSASSPLVNDLRMILRKLEELNNDIYI